MTNQPDWWQSNNFRVTVEKGGMCRINYGSGASVSFPTMLLGELIDLMCEVETDVGHDLTCVQCKGENIQ